MKKNLLLTLLIFMLSLLHMIAQDSIWIERFSYPNGTTTAPGPTMWTLANTGKAKCQDSTLHIFNYGTTWTSEWIRIDSFYNISWSYDVTGNVGNSMDYHYFIVEYNNGDRDTLYYDNGTVSDNFVNGTLPNTLRDSVQLILKADPRVRNYYFDNIALLGNKRTSYPTVTINLQNSNSQNLEGIKVEVAGFGTHYSDASGNVMFQASAPLEDIPFTVSDTTDGYGVASGIITLYENTPDTLVSISLDSGYVVQLKAQNIENDPIQGTTASLEGYGDSITMTDGMAVFHDVTASDSIYFSLTANGFSFIEDSIAVMNDNVMKTITLDSAFNVFITVMEQDSTPIHGATVVLDGYGEITTTLSGTASYSKILTSNGLSYTAYETYFYANSNTITVADKDVYDTIMLDTRKHMVWYESFSHPDGTTTDAGATQWTVTAGANTETRNGEMFSNDKGGTWSSAKIAIDSLNGLEIDAVQFSIVINKPSGHGADDLRLSFELDGVETVFYDNGNAFTGEVSVENIVGDTLQFFWYNWSNVSGRHGAIDDIVVTVPLVTPNAAITPVNQSSGIALDSVIAITFDQEIFDMMGDTVKDFTPYIMLKENDADGSAIPYTAEINAANDSITVIPDAPFGNGQFIYVEVKNLENIWGAGMDTTASTFRTLLAVPDTVMAMPANGSVGHSTYGDITAKFDMAIFEEDLSGITVMQDATIISSMAAVGNDSTLTISQNGLPSSSEITVTIPAGAVTNEDAIANAEIIWSFTTDTAPVVASVTPADQSTGNAANAEVKAIFAENIAEEDFSGITIKNGANVIPVTPSIVNDTVLMLNHTDFSENGTYVVTIPMGTVVNTNAMANDEIIWSFEVAGVGTSNITVTDVKMYPVPVKDELTIETENGAQIEIIDMLGSTLLSTIATSNIVRIDASAISSPMAVVKVTTDKGETVKTILFHKQ